jgi:oxygen-independent coproporphyrinogen III oxidase
MSEAHQAHVDLAKERMTAAYADLPDGFFSGKDAASYRFNNIESLLDRIPVTVQPSAQVRDEELGAGGVTVYAGVPWCERICSFCNFAYSTSSSPEKHQHYLDLLRQEVGQFFGASEVPVRSIYFGGGTPTYLERDLLQRHLTQLQPIVNMAAGSSITCEFSTSTISSDKLSVMADCGVGRISTGLQSLDDDTRKRANLVGEGVEALKALELAARHFRNFNVDLIYGHPYQSHQDWITTVATVAALGIPSITLYRLELKTRTTFKKIYSRDSQDLTDEMRARLHYFMARQILEDEGYAESPLGWWVKKDTLRKNATWLDYLSVWSNATPYLGFGQGAFSVGRSFHWRNESTSREWESKVAGGALPATVVKRMNPVIVVLNQFMRHVRTIKTFDLAAVSADFARLGALEALQTTVDECLAWGLVRPNESGSHDLTEAGESLVHWIFAALTERVGDAIVASEAGVPIQASAA